MGSEQARDVLVAVVRGLAASVVKSAAKDVDALVADHPKAGLGPDGCRLLVLRELSAACKAEIEPDQGNWPEYAAAIERVRELEGQLAAVTDYAAKCETKLAKAATMIQRAKARTQ